MTLADDWDPTDRVRALSHLLVGWPSETGTADEAGFAEHLADLLRQIPYFRDHPQDLVLLPSHGRPVTRNLIAVVRGRGRQAVALAGHYDTVSIANYGDLVPLARDPAALAGALIAELGSRPRAPQEERAFVDLTSGDFVPGRGMLDMKSGIAAGIAVLEQFARQPDRTGNLVLIATPDEERASRGMLSLRDALPGLMAAWDLDLVAGINLDATSDLGDGTQGRSIHHGSIGKLLPFAYVIGRACHAGYPFEGVSATAIAAEIVSAIEINPALADQGAGLVSPPPICLEAGDRREGYEVTTPDRTWLAFNWLFHDARPAAIFARFEEAVGRAVSTALSRAEAAAATYDQMTGTRPVQRDWQGQVIRVEALTAVALADGGPAAAARYQSLAQSLETHGNPLTVTRQLVEALVAEARVRGPAVIVGIAGLHYPPVRLDPSQELDQALLRAASRARARIEDRFGTRIIDRPYFQGISDMSFFGAGNDTGGQVGGSVGADIIAANTPAPHLVDRPPADALRFPIVNIGPWGREYHQRLERVHAPYAFTILPHLLWQIVTLRLKASD